MQLAKLLVWAVELLFLFIYAFALLFYADRDGFFLSFLPVVSAVVVDAERAIAKPDDHTTIQTLNNAKFCAVIVLFLG